VHSQGEVGVPAVDGNRVTGKQVTEIKSHFSTKKTQVKSHGNEVSGNDVTI